MSRPPINARDAAEAAFKQATTKPVEAPPAPKPAEKPAGLPNAREMIALRIDRDVIEHFQAGGPGWQDRVNGALRKAAGLS